MSEWKTVKLGDVCETTSGGTPSRSKKEYWNGEIPWIKSGAMNLKEINQTEEFITELGLKNSSAKFFEKDTVVMAMYGATAGKTSILKIKATTNQAVCGIIPRDEKILDKYYLLFLLKSMEKFFVSRAHGGGQPNISQSIIKDAEIPLPPLPVQKQIVSILEKAENLKQKRNETNKETQKIIQSLFYEMFGDPVKNEKGWDVKTLNDVCDVIMGQSPSGNSYNNKEEGMAFFQGKAEFGEKYPVVKKWTSEPSKVALPNDTLISVRAPVGTANMSNQECCIGRGLAAIRSGEKVNQEFLFRFIQLSEKRLESKGTGSTFKAISGKDVRDFDIIVPPLTLQDEFAKKVQLIESIQSKQQASTEEINTLFNALMQKAFKGELVE